MVVLNKKIIVEELGVQLPLASKKLYFYVLFSLDNSIRVCSLQCTLEEEDTRGRPF